MKKIMCQANFIVVASYYADKHYTAVDSLFLFSK